MGRAIDVNKEIPHIIDSIKQYFVENGSADTKAIIGISGGKDSTIAAALLVRALGADRVIGVLMPNGDQSDIMHSREVCQILGIKSYEINIGEAVDALTASIVAEVPDGLNDAYNTNTPARVRMTTLYGIAALIGGRVINTGNWSEFYVGYTTKYGDLAGDFAILRNYTVREVYMIGDALEELPEYLVHKVPGDGMSGKSDEDNLGFTYDVLDDYLLNGIIPSYDTFRNIHNRHQRNKHKEAINLPAVRPLSRKFYEW